MRTIPLLLVVFGLETIAMAPAWGDDRYDRDLVLFYCSRCHAADQYYLAERSEKAWHLVVKRMQANYAYYDEGAFTDEEAVGRQLRRERLAPDLEHVPNVLERHLRQGEIVAGRKADNPTGAFLAFQAGEGIRVRRRQRRVGQQGGEVVGEDEGIFVFWVAVAAGSLITGTQVAIWIICRAGVRRRFLYLPLPGTLGAMG